jgi:hypothetical protein
MRSRKMIICDTETMTKPICRPISGLRTVKFVKIVRAASAHTQAVFAASP